MIVCSCYGITDRDVRRAVRQERETPGPKASACLAGTACGGCARSIRALIEEERALTRATPTQTTALLPLRELPA